MLERPRGAGTYASAYTSARRCPGRHLGAASLGQCASRAALTGHIGGRACQHRRPQRSRHASEEQQLGRDAGGAQVPQAAVLLAPVQHLGWAQLGLGPTGSCIARPGPAPGWGWGLGLGLGSVRVRSHRQLYCSPRSSTWLGLGLGLGSVRVRVRIRSHRQLYGSPRSSTWLGINIRVRVRVGVS
eukprot:scaffold21634_cov63-Phaeocystis_antarctica.AAC.4